MKPKTLSKKLFLNKNTVVNMNQQAMSRVKGGETGVTCNYCNSDISCMPQNCDYCCTEYTGCECTDASCGWNQCNFDTHYTNCCDYYTNPVNGCC